MKVDIVAGVAAVCIALYFSRPKPSLPKRTYLRSKHGDNFWNQVADRAPWPATEDEE